MTTGKADQAITAFRKLLMLDAPDPVDVHYQLARLLHARGDPEATRQVLQALEDAPRYQDALRLLLEIDAQNPQPTPGPATSKPEVTP
jgi:tetratricopeptide (TPR) repeat protein